MLRHLVSGLCISSDTDHNGFLSAVDCEEGNVKQRWQWEDKPPPVYSRQGGHIMDSL